MAINLDRRIFSQGGRTGLQQVDARPLVDAGNRFAQFGKDIQNLGVATAEYLAQQQALHNDNLKVQGEQNFTKKLNAGMQNAEFGELQADGTRKLPEVTDMGPKAVKAMVKQQQEILKGIPKLRRPGFLKTTNSQILAAQNKLAGLANTRVKADARGLDIDFKNDYLSYAGQLNPEELARGTQNYERRLARGALSGVYDPPDVANLLDIFNEDVADTVQNHKTSIMFQGEPTVADIRQRIKEISADLNLNPKEKDARNDSIWRRAGEMQRQRQISLEAIAKKKDQDMRNFLSTKLVDSRLDPTGKNGVNNSDVLEAIAGGLRTPSWIKKFTELANGNEALLQLGEEDNDPAAGYMKEMGQLEIKAITGGWTTPSLLKEIDNLREKATSEYVNDPNKMLTHLEIAQLDAKAVAIIKEFKDDGKRNLAEAQQLAEARLKFLLGGSDKNFDQFNSSRNDQVTDTIAAARLLIAQGDRWDVAVDKAREQVTVDKRKGISEFRAEDFEGVLKKASGGKLSKNDRLILDEMIERRNERIKKVTRK
tara:strand:- start:130 stop:1746 length:1617 start_codon:yes stop_codon:yes gene_type:complete